MQRINNPVQKLHDALAHARWAGLDTITYSDRDWEHYRQTGEHREVVKSRSHASDEVVVVGMFPQTWPSTALGFGGLGGAAVTTDYTVVLSSTHCSDYLVYFGGKFAYMIQKPNTLFFEHLGQRQMAAVRDSYIYQGINNEPTNTGND